MLPSSWQLLTAQSHTSLSQMLQNHKKNINCLENKCDNSGVRILVKLNCLIVRYTTRQCNPKWNCSCYKSLKMHKTMPKIYGKISKYKTHPKVFFWLRQCMQQTEVQTLSAYREDIGNHRFALVKVEPLSFFVKVHHTNHYTVLHPSSIINIICLTASTGAC